MYECILSLKINVMECRVTYESVKIANILWPVYIGFTIVLQDQ